MKKRIALLLCFVLAVLTVLTGCGGDKKASASAGGDKDSGKAQEEEEELVEVTINEVAHSIFYAPQYVALEKGYFQEEGLEVTLVNGFGADKTMAALLAGEADIGFMGAEASIYAYQEEANDTVVNFAQLTQRAGNFLVAREEMPDFTWENLKGTTVLGGRKGGMPEMVFE